MVIAIAYFKAHALAVPEGRPLWHVVRAWCPGSLLLCVFLTCVRNLSKPKIWLSGVLLHHEIVLLCFCAGGKLLLNPLWPACNCVDMYANVMTCSTLTNV